jgi:hypothetical protein
MEPDQCWRMVYQADGSDRPMPCPEPVEWRGRFKNRQGWHVVDSCDGHVDDKLVGVKRLAPASTTCSEAG